MKSIIILHLSVLIGTFLSIPFGSLLLPYIYWRILRKQEDDSFSMHACNILNFQLILCILFYGSMTILWGVFIRNMAHDIVPNYRAMIVPVAIFLCLNIVYPIFIVCHMRIKKMYYPNIIQLFKH